MLLVDHKQALPTGQLISSNQETWHQVVSERSGAATMEEGSPEPHCGSAPPTEDSGNAQARACGGRIYPGTGPQLGTAVPGCGVGSPRREPRGRSMQGSAGSQSAKKPQRFYSAGATNARSDTRVSAARSATTTNSSSVDEQQSGWSPTGSCSRLWWPQGAVEVVLNVLGTAGFVIGSFMWVFDKVVVGSWTFAMACVLCGVACMLYGVKFLYARSGVGAYSLCAQALGCFMFTAASILFLDSRFEMLGLLGFLTASLLFLAGCTLSQVICRSLVGPLAPMLPGIPRQRCAGLPWLPSLLLNTSGSVLFVTGSGLLFYPWGALPGAWCYSIGSILFFVASWADFTTWCNITALTIKARRRRYCDARSGGETHQLHQARAEGLQSPVVSATAATTAPTSPGATSTVDAPALLNQNQPTVGPGPATADPNGDYSRIKFL